MWYQQQHIPLSAHLPSRCDLLKNIYLCGINNNLMMLSRRASMVVICLKISTFVVSTTTQKRSRNTVISCDLLKNIYLCGINNNRQGTTLLQRHVVICLKISTFVVSTTTRRQQIITENSCDLLKNIYLCGINNN